MEQIAAALLIFCLRVADVSIGTLRVLYAVRGQRLIAAGLGVLESGIFIFAISRIFLGATAEPMKMIGYALGFATGTALGMTMERWIGSGWVLLRIISREHSQQLQQVLREKNFGVTAVRGEGREGPVLVLFIAALRRRGQEALRIVQQTDPEAFVTIDTITTAMGGYLPQVAAPASVRK